MHAIIMNMLALCKMVWLNSKLTAVIIPCYFITVVATLFDKARDKNQRIYFILTMMYTILLIPGYHKGVNDYSMIAFLPLGLEVMLLNRKADRNLKLLWVCGFAYMCMINMSSNTIINASSHASSVSMIASILLLDEYIRTFKLHKVETKKLGYCVLILMICNYSYDKLTVTFLDGNPLHMNSVLEKGCGKYLITTKENKQFYDRELEHLETVLSNTSGPVLLYTDVTWMNFSLKENQKNAIYSIWYNVGDENADQRLLQYYELLEENKPVMVYVPSINQGLETYLMDHLDGYQVSKRFDDGAICYCLVDGGK